MNLQDLRLHLASDFRIYTQWACEQEGYPLAPFQPVVADFLQGARPRWIRRKKVILGARGFAKTWQAVRKYAEWRILRQPLTQIIIHSSTDKLASGITASLLNTFRHNPLFSHLRPRGQPGSTAFSIRRMEKGDQVTSVGINTAMTGSRSVLYIFDDPEPDANPEAYWQRCINAFQEAELILHPIDHLWPGEGDVPVPEVTNYLVVGQPHWTGTAYIPPAPDALTGEVEPHPLSDAIFLKIPALVPCKHTHPDAAWSEKKQRWERSLMPSRFKSADLIRQRDDKIIDPARWRLQMELDTTPMEGVGSVIKTSALPQLHCRPAEVKKMCMVVDPADSEEACEWGVVIGGLFEHRIHIMDLMGFRREIWNFADEVMPGIEAWETIFETADQLGVREIYIEKNMKTAITSAKRVLREMRVNAQVYEYAETQNKLKRICNALDHPCNTGLISFEPHVLIDPQNAKQLNELRYTSLPKPNDRIDAFAALVSILHEGSAVATPIRNRQQIGGGSGNPVPVHFQRLNIRESPIQRLRRTG